MNALKNSLRSILHYPSAVVGILIVLLLVFTAIYAMVKIPYQEAIHLWRGGEEVWYQNPKFAPPAWINLFSSKKYSESFAVSTSDGSMPKTVTQESPEIATIAMSYPFDFNYDEFLNYYFQLQERTQYSLDAEEGKRAYREKRDPVWQ